MSRIRCYPHARPILPDLTAFTNDLVRGPGPNMCVCGEPWTAHCWDVHCEEWKAADGRGKLREFLSRYCDEKEPSGDGESTPEPRWYFGTFTQPPDIDDNDPTRILKATRKVMHSKMVDAISWCYSIELMKNGSPHTHFAVYTRKYPNKHKIFKFNVSAKGAQYRSEWEREIYDVKKYIQKPVTKPDSSYCDKWGLTDTIVYSPEFPEELKPKPMV